MGGQYGIKETKDVLDLVIGCVAMEIVKEIKKDGFQITDLGAFIKSPEFEAKLGAAIENIALVPSEAVEIDLFDGIALGRYAYGLMSELIDQLRK